MRTRFYLSFFLLITVLSSCTTTAPVSITRAEAYKNWYAERPLTILLMPPINKSTEVEAKEYFHSTLNVPLANAGFYVIPPFLSMEILKKESAYDAELFLEESLTQFGEFFGADLAFFTIIHKWDKSALEGQISVKVEYLVKSTRNNEILYSRIGDIFVDSSVSLGVAGVLGALVDAAATAINTAATKYVDVARKCNAYSLSDMPRGKYNPFYEKDGSQPAGSKVFNVSLNSAYR